MFRRRFLELQLVIHARDAILPDFAEILRVTVRKSVGLTENDFLNLREPQCLIEFGGRGLVADLIRLSQAI